MFRMMVKRSRTLLVLSFVLVSVLIVQAAPKIVLCENFTNTGCGPCAPASRHLNDVYAANSDIFVIIRYHTSGPSPSDPFHLHNPIENSARSAFYSITGVPTTIVDGTSISWPSITDASIRTRASVDASIDLEVLVTGPDSVRVTFTVEDEGPTGNVRVFAVVTEDSLHFTAPNGLTEFHQVMRKMLSGSSGLNVSVVPGETYSFDFHVEIDEEAWDIDNCNVVAFIQATGSSTRIYQTAITPLFAPLDYEYFARPTGNFAEMVGELDIAELGFRLLNRGINTDTYTITFLSDHLPPPWDVTLRSDVIGDFTTEDFTMPGFSEHNFSLVVNPNGHRDHIDIPVIVSSDHLGTAETLHFAIVTPNDYLLVNASGDSETGELYQTMMGFLRLPYSYWDQAHYGVLSNFEAMNWHAIFWISGENHTNPIDIGPRTALYEYVTAHDGKLFISGNRIGEHARSDFNLFYRTFGAMNSAAYAPDETIYIVRDNPVMSRGYFVIDVDSVESMLPYPTVDAEAIVQYSYERYGGVINDLSYFDDDDYIEGGRVVYLSFGLEQVTGGTDILRFLRHCYDWLMTGDAVYEEKLQTLPESYQMITAFPTPFNAACNIIINPTERGPITVEVHDVRGRIIDTIYEGSSDGRPFSLTWRPDYSVSSGIYIISLRGESGVLENAKTIFIK